MSGTSETSETSGGSETDEFRFLESDAQRVGRTPPLLRVERRWFDVSEGRRVAGLSFTPEGSPREGSPRIVALHGAGLNAHSYDPMLLSLGAPALSLDLPGHGRSDWRGDADYRPQNLAPDIVLALEALDGLEPFVLVGHSLGGLTASLVAAAIPDRVERLVVLDITPGLQPNRDAGTVTDFIQGQRDYGSVDEIVDRAIRFGIGSDRAALTRGVALNTRLRSDGRLEWTHHLAHLDGLAAGGEPQPYAPVWDALESLEIPITQIRADAGIVTDEMVAEWRERLPGSDVVTLAGPHNLHEAAPVELAAAIHSLL